MIENTKLTNWLRSWRCRQNTQLKKRNAPRERQRYLTRQLHQRPNPRLVVLYIRSKHPNYQHTLSTRAMTMWWILVTRQSRISHIRQIMPLPDNRVLIDASLASLRMRTTLRSWRSLSSLILRCPRMIQISSWVMSNLSKLVKFYSISRTLLLQKPNTIRISMRSKYRKNWRRWTSSWNHNLKR